MMKFRIFSILFFRVLVGMLLVALCALLAVYCLFLVLRPGPYSPPFWLGFFFVGAGTTLGPLLMMWMVDRIFRDSTKVGRTKS